MKTKLCAVLAVALVVGASCGGGGSLVEQGRPAGSGAGESPPVAPSRPNQPEPEGPTSRDQPVAEVLQNRSDRSTPLGVVCWVLVETAIDLAALQTADLVGGDERSSALHVALGEAVATLRWAEDHLPASASALPGELAPFVHRLAANASHLKVELEGASSLEQSGEQLSASYAKAFNFGGYPANEAMNEAIEADPAHCAMDPR